MIFCLLLSQAYASEIAALSNRFRIRRSIVRKRVPFGNSIIGKGAWLYFWPLPCHCGIHSHKAIASRGQTATLAYESFTGELSDKWTLIVRLPTTNHPAPFKSFNCAVKRDCCQRCSLKEIHYQRMHKLICHTMGLYSA